MSVSLLLRRALLAAGLALTALAPMACGGEGDRPSFAAVDSTPAPDRVAGGALSGAGTGGAALIASPPPAQTEPVEAITIVATDNAFGPAAFRIRAGQPFTVTLENRGRAAHDWRVRGLAAADGRDAGSRLLTPGQSEAVTLAVDRPGDFTLYCEIHPADMRGTLSVVPDQSGATTLTADR